MFMESTAEHLKRRRRHATDWEKILVKNISDKELLPKTYRECLNQSKRKHPSQTQHQRRYTDGK